MGVSPLTPIYPLNPPSLNLPNSVLTRVKTPHSPSTPEPCSLTYEPFNSTVFVKPGRHLRDLHDPIRRRSQHHQPAHPPRAPPPRPALRPHRLLRLPAPHENRQHPPPLPNHNRQRALVPRRARDPDLLHHNDTARRLRRTLRTRRRPGVLPHRIRPRNDHHAEYPRCGAGRGHGGTDP